MLKAISKFFSKPETNEPEENQYGYSDPAKMMNFLADFGYGFTGETTPMMFGDTRIYDLDYYTLRERSWQLYVENEYVPIIVNRLAEFVVGEGLKLQSEPASKVLSKFGVTIDPKKWTDDVESLFGLYACLPNAAQNGLANLHQLAKIAYVHAKIAGDILVITRIDKNNQLKIQLIDGANVMTPQFSGKDLTKKGKLESTRIDNGVEIDKKGQHVAYWVRKLAIINDDGSKLDSSLDFERVPAYGKQSGRKVSWLVYGNKYRIGETRGMPMLTCIMQKIKQLDRYSKAELTAAEENAKFVATIQHKSNSSGDNPLQKTGIGSRQNRNVAPPEFAASRLTGDQIAGTLSKSTQGTVVNLGIDQELKSHDTKRPNANYGAFVDVSFKYICAACNVPLEVGLMLFSNNYSASRAALKMFEYMLINERQDICTIQFYKPIYSSFVTLKTLSGLIKTNGFLKALNSNDYLFREAYFKCRFIGKPIPNVDELKEVKASIEKIKFKLSTYEKETEKLGNGDFKENMLRLRDELQLIDDELSEYDKSNDEKSEENEPNSEDTEKENEDE